MARFAAVGAGRMGRGIAIAFAYAGHRIALVDLRQRSREDWQRLCDEWDRAYPTNRVSAVEEENDG